MNWLREYRIQIVFVVIHSAIIVYGILFTAAFLKASGHHHFDDLTYLPFFVRKAGLLYFIIPALWAAGTIWLENICDWDSRILSFVTGFAVIFLLWMIMSNSMVKASRPPKIRASGEASAGECYFPDLIRLSETGSRMRKYSEA